MDEEIVYQQEADVSVEEHVEVVEEVTSAPASKPAVNPLMQKLPLLIGAVAVVVVLILGVSMLFGGGGGATVEEDTVIWAKIGEDGEAYIILPDGKIIEIDDEVQSAAMTKDRKHIVVLLEDGTLYVTDKNQKEEVEIEEDCSGFSIPNDECFYYYTVDEDEDIPNPSYYLVLLKDYSVVELGESLSALGIAKETPVVLYADEKGVHLLQEGEEEGNKISKLSEDEGVYALFNAVANNGKLAVWSEVDYYNDTCTIYLYEDDDKVKLTELDTYRAGTRATFSEDQKLLVVSNYYCEYLWLKTPGKEEIKVKLGGEFSGYPIYTKDGLLAYQKASSVSGLYVAVDSGDYHNVYYITKDGDRERVLSDVRDFDIINGYIVYLDDEYNLHCAKLNKDELKNEIEIEDDVDRFIVPYNGNYVYFIKDRDGSEGTLYGYKLGDKEAVKVKSGVYAPYLGTSVDGKTVLFYKDVAYIRDSDYKQGTLMTWTFGAKEPVKVSSDVMFGSPTSSVNIGVNPKSFVFAKFSGVEDDTIYVNMMRWNGKEDEKLVSDVRY